MKKKSISIFRKAILLNICVLLAFTGCSRERYATDEEMIEHFKKNKTDMNENTEPVRSFPHIRVSGFEKYPYSRQIYEHQTDSRIPTSSLSTAQSTPDAMFIRILFRRMICILLSV